MKGARPMTSVDPSTHLAGFPTLLISPRLVSDDMELHAV